METQKDLFGKIVKEKVRKPTQLEKSLLDYDKASFNDRLKRLNYIKKFIQMVYYCSATWNLYSLLVKLKNVTLMDIS